MLNRIQFSAIRTSTRTQCRSYSTIPINTKIITPSALDTNPEQVTVTLFPGHGIGPEISDAVVKILDAAKANIAWQRHDIATTPDENGKTLCPLIAS